MTCKTAFPLLVCAVFLGVILISCDSSGPSTEESFQEDPSSEATLELGATTERKAIYVDWNGSGFEDPDRYRLYRSSSADFDTAGSFHAEVSSTEYFDEEVEPSKTYHYRVGAFDRSGDPIVVSEDQEGLAPPGSPEDLKGTGGFYEANLRWSEAEGKISGYSIYRSVEHFSAPEEAERVERFTDSTGYVDETALDGKSYVYRVAANDESGYEGELSPPVTITPGFEGDPSKGKQVFQANCASCHISGNGWDLQAFSMPDTMIHRRALKHVTEEEALDIIEYVDSGDIKPFEDARFGKRSLPPFQPGDKIVASDKKFALDLFGADKWPEDLSIEEMKAIDVSEVSIPFPLPHWNLEHNETDWLPTRRMPDRISGQSSFESALSDYQSQPTDQNFFDLYDTVHKLQRKKRDRHPHRFDADQEEMAEVYDLNRWSSSLVGLHVMRKNGDTVSDFRSFLRRHEGRGNRSEKWEVLGKYWSLAAEMWRTGSLMRVSADRESVKLPPDYEGAKTYKYLSAARWFYLSWMLTPGTVPSFDILYFPRVLKSAGYPRVAAFFAAHVVTHARHGQKKVYDVLVDFPAPIPEDWVPNFAHFILDAYIDRIQSGDELHGSTRHQQEHLKKGVRSMLDENGSLTTEDKSHIRSDLKYVLDWLKEQNSDQ